MFPVLFSIGPVTLRTMSLFVILSFFVSSFIFWRKGREEHYKIIELFDSFILSTVVGLSLARLAHILLNFDQFGLDILKWFDFINFSGINLIVGIVAASIYIYQFSLKKKWDAFEVLDFWVTSISLGISVNFVGLFFEGVGYGNATQLPWGVVFPQLIDPHHPAQLYSAIFYLLLYFYLSRIEYSYRTISWYRHGKKTAQTGFLVSTFLIITAIYNFLIIFLRPTNLAFFGINFDLVISVALFIFGLSILFYRSGRSFPISFNKKPKPVRTKIENLSE
ncbi:MAG: prolipoprotein diacylglyceryl transferase [Pseudomonadales bacterium]|nr:prolipoprotein diacylglyceryl transferase [Pseudomonadales bacterium]